MLEEKKGEKQKEAFALNIFALIDLRSVKGIQGARTAGTKDQEKIDIVMDIEDLDNKTTIVQLGPIRKSKL